MSKPKFIEKHLEIPKGMDYAFLKKEGIRKIQQLASDNWTDFNEHDPGITILEQLAYALSDLGYKTQMDFKDLFASQQNITDNNTFYSAANILPTNPVTIKDIRKLILDKVNGIQNVWIYPLNSFTRRKNIQGLFLVFVELSSYHEMTEENIKKEVKDLLNHYHNIGETFEEVVILKQKEIFLTSSIELEKDAVAERVHANVLFKLKELISNPITYYSLNQMLDLGYPVEEIFDGPQLENGFILNKDLKEKHSIFFNSQMVNHLREIDGVKTIKSLNLVEEVVDDFGEVTYENYFDDLSNIVRTEIAVVPWDSIGVLARKLQNDANNENFFNYTSDGIKINLYQKEVDRQFKELNASTKQKTSKNLDQKNDFSPPEGKQLTINNYRSIQHEFPAMYGLGNNSISGHTPSQRKTEIYQLKGFLLFFEQILSNYLAQLSRFNELYSLEKSISESYFVQVPWDIPEIYKLIKLSEDAKTEKKKQSHIQKTIERLMANIDNFYERRSKFLAHLLVRFGDDSHKHNFEKFNYYHSPENHKTQLLNQQIDILKNYPELSREKARSFNHTLPFWKEEGDESFKPNLSVLESRIRIMLGIPQELTKIGEFLLPKVNFEGKNHIISFHQVFSEQENLKIKNSVAEPMGLWTREEEFQDAANPKIIRKIVIDEDIFKRGLYLDNLKVLKSSRKNEFHLLFNRKRKAFPREVKEVINLLSDEPESDDSFSKELAAALSKNNLNESDPLTKGIIEVQRILNKEKKEDTIYLQLFIDGKPKYCVQFDRNITKRFAVQPTNVWEILQTFKKEELAFECGYSLRNILKNWNQKSESLYIMDHILLRPQYDNVELNILLNDPNSNWSFRLLEGHSIEETDKGIKKEILRMRESNYQILFENDLYSIVWKEGDKIIGRCTQEFKEKNEAEKTAKEIKKYALEFSNLDIHDPNRVKFKREFDNEEEFKHSLIHYSFTISVFLSNWTSRFSDKEFQYYLESLIRKHTAAHIGIKFNWVDLKSFAEFERIYGLWLDENRKEKIDYSAMNKFADELLTFTKNVNSES